jgi:hypothetical protein
MVPGPARKMIKIPKKDTENLFLPFDLFMSKIKIDEIKKKFKSKELLGPPTRERYPCRESMPIGNPDAGKSSRAENP